MDVLGNAAVDGAGVDPIDLDGGLVGCALDVRGVPQISQYLIERWLR